MTLDKHIIIFGYGPYGKKLANSLRQNYSKITIVDQYMRHLKLAEDDGFTDLVTIDVHQDHAFESLHISQESVAFCAFEDEAYNIYLTISLRSIYPNLSIIAFGQIKESHHKLIMAGANQVVVIEEAAANTLYNLLINPTVSSILDQIFNLDDALSIAEIIIQEDSPLKGKFLKDINEQTEYNVIILGLVDLELSHKFVFATSGHNHKIDPGDALVIVGRKEDIIRCKKEC